jgi:hypothetical protein
MERRTLIHSGVLAAGLALLAGCSTLRTTSDWDPARDFSKYRTFAFKKVRPEPNEIVDARIRRAIEAALVARGLRRDDGDPDLRVVTHYRLGHEKELVSYNSGWGYGWRWRGGGGVSTTRVRNVPVGTLIVDLVDAREKELAWRGTASDTVRNDTPTEKEQALGEAMTKMFETYPPKK